MCRGALAFSALMGVIAALAPRPLPPVWSAGRVAVRGKYFVRQRAKSYSQTGLNRALLVLTGNTKLTGSGRPALLQTAVKPATTPAAVVAVKPAVVVAAKPAVVQSSQQQ